MIYRYLFCIVAYAICFQAAANADRAEYSSMPAVDGVINPFRVVDISSPVAGIIEKLYVERSEKVSAGQMVAQLDASVERANVALAKYRAGVESEIGLGQVNISFDRLRKKRVDSLLEEQNISRENADQIDREVQLSKWKLKQAKELLEIRKLELRRAEEQLRQKSIRAPFDGYVLDTFKYRGEYVEEQSIIRIAQLDPLVIETIVPMEYFGTIEVGMLAEIRPEVLFEDKLMARVTAVDRIGDTASNTFGIKLSMPNPENRIPAGLKCIVKFIAKTPEAVAEETETRSSTAEADSAALLAAINDADVIETALSDAVAADQRHQQPLTKVTDHDQVNRPSTRKTPSSYMVSITQPETTQATRNLISGLRNAGVHDLLELDYGANKGLISLGIYNARSFAAIRQQQLDGLGFASFIVERYR
jgi:RND family efflux transporter MFP subunit